MPPQITPSQAPSINQHITDGTPLLLLLQPTNQSSPTPGSSTLLSSPLQHQANCLQAIRKTIQLFNQHLKTEHLDRQALQLIVLHLQNDFSLLCYLLFSPVKQSLARILPLKTLLPVLFLTLTLILILTLTLLRLPFPLPAMVNQNFVILPRWALWDHPEQKDTFLQMPISSPHPTCPCNYGAESHIKNLKTRKIFCR